MRGGRSFVILLVLALGIGGYAYFVESQKDLTDPKTKKEKVFTIDASKIEELELKPASGESTTLKKADTTWSITSPKPLDADQGEVSSIASAFESIQAGRVVDDHPASTAPFGLSPAVHSVGARLAGETTMHRLLVGNKTPNGSDFYAQVEGKPAVFLIGAYETDPFTKAQFDVRDKTVLKFSHDGVDALKIEAPKEPAVSLAKKGTQWRLTAPLDSKADFAAVDGVVSKVEQTRAKSFETEDIAKDPKDAKKFGFDAPQATVTIGVGSTRATLVIGAKKDDSSVYARDLTRPLVFAIDSAILADIKKKPDDLRSKDLFEFHSFDATSVDLTYKGVTYSFVKQAVPATPVPASTATPTATPAAAPPTEVWKQITPVAKDANLTAMTDTLTNVSGLRADKFADKAAASGEDLIVSAKFGDPSSLREEKITLRKSGTTVQAIRAGEPGAAIVPTADFDKALASFKELAGIK